MMNLQELRPKVYVSLIADLFQTTGLLNKKIYRFQHAIAGTDVSIKTYRHKAL
jgi:hypothetical protein